jgi:hypothetical protein
MTRLFHFLFDPARWDARFRWHFGQTPEVDASLDALRSMQGADPRTPEALVDAIIRAPDTTEWLKGEPVARPAAKLDGIPWFLRRQAE